MQQHINKSAMINGLIIGALFSLKFLLGATKSGLLSLFGLSLFIYTMILLYRFTKNFRDKECDGYISYNHAFSYLFLLFFYGSIIESLVMLIYNSFIDKKYLGYLFDTMMQFYEKIHYVIPQQAYNSLEVIFTPTPYSLTNILGSAVFAVFWGLILAAFIKKDKSIFDNNDNLA